MALGNFDGVHRGHQQILRRAIEEAGQQRLVSILFTFNPHPSRVLRSPGELPKLILTNEEKQEILAKKDFEIILNQTFSREFSLMEAEAFIKEVLIDQLKAKVVCIGENFRFGHKAVGDIRLLRKEQHFQVPQIENVREGGTVLSSSVIRKLIQDGEIERANAALGYPYFLSGIVKHGDGRGKTIGFPTANIETQKECLPATGVYAGFLEFKGVSYLAAINCGFRPTFEGHEFQIEAHLIDQKIELYGEHIRLSFLKKVRNEMKFSDVRKLQDQIKKDIEGIRSQNLS